MWSVKKSELLSAKEMEQVYSFDDILSQLEDFRDNRSAIFEHLRLSMMNGLNERIKAKELAQNLMPVVLDNKDNVFFQYYSELLTKAYMKIGEPVLMPKDYVIEMLNHKKLVEQARTELQKQFDEILQAMNDERNFDYSATGEILVALQDLQLAVIRTEDSNTVYRVADKLLLSFFYEFSYAVSEAGIKVCECRFCKRHFLGTSEAVCCGSDACQAEHTRLKKQQLRQNRKNSPYTHEADNYNTYVRNRKKEMKIAGVSPLVMDEFEDLKKTCKAVVDRKKKECEEFGLPVEELVRTIEEQEGKIKAFQDGVISGNRG